MKETLSAFEVHVLVNELNEQLQKSKIEQIYLLEDKDLIIQFHIPSVGKKILRAKVPDFFYLTNQKPETPATPHGFCLFLRKYLKQARLQEVKQLEFERIINLIFQAKEKTYQLLLEFIPPGNIILCDAENKVLSPLETQQWKDRTIRGGVQYTYPKKERSFLALDEKELNELIETSKKDSLVKILALDLGLGGEYAEYLCREAKLEKTKKLLSREEVKELYHCIQQLKKKRICPIITKQREIYPFALMEEAEPAKTTTFSEALDSILTTKVEKKKQTEQELVLKKTSDKQQKIVEMQKLNKLRLEQEYEFFQRKGELIYQNYLLVRDILEQLKEARKTMSWQEIKGKLTAHKIIKQINEKDNEIIVEL